MIELIKRWLGRDEPTETTSPPTVVPKPVRPRPPAPDVEMPNDVIRRSKFVREDTGTHETLKIVDDDLELADEVDGIDPYNTGGFDRSKNWDSRFRK